VRLYYQAFGNSSSGSPVQLGLGKDATIAPGTDFTALIDSDVRLKREDFSAGEDAPTTPAAEATQAPQSHR
jgi:hypothetical protein